jgi:hypothetical protein
MGIVNNNSRHAALVVRLLRRSRNWLRLKQRHLTAQTIHQLREVVQTTSTPSATKGKLHFE